MKFMSTIEASILWGVSRQFLHQHCRKGNIPGAYKDNSTWNIPVTTHCPVQQKRTFYPLRLRVGVLNEIKNGASPEELARNHALQLSTIKYWQSKEDSIRKRYRHQLVQQAITLYMDGKSREDISCLLDIPTEDFEAAINQYEKRREDNAPDFDYMRKALDDYIVCGVVRDVLDKYDVRHSRLLYWRQWLKYPERIGPVTEYQKVILVKKNRLGASTEAIAKEAGIVHKQLLRWRHKYLNSPLSDANVINILRALSGDCPESAEATVNRVIQDFCDTNGIDTHIGYWLLRGLDYFAFETVLRSKELTFEYYGQNLRLTYEHIQSLIMEPVKGTAALIEMPKSARTQTFSDDFKHEVINF